MTLQSPHAQEVLIAVQAAGLNRADLLQRRGLYPPPPGVTDVLGLEVCGTIIACGLDVGDWRVGDAVCALLPGGGHTKRAIAHVSCLLPKPETYNILEAAGLPEALFTVWNNIFVRGNLQPGQTLLITGGASGIGTLAIQMAKHIAGAQVIALCQAGKMDAIKSLGADIVRDYRDPGCYDDLPPVHVVLDMIGGDAIAKHMQVMAPDARHVSIAYLGGQSASIDVQMMMRKRLTLTGSTLRGRPWVEMEELRNGIMQRAWPHIEAGRIRPIIHQSFPLAQADVALDALAAGHHIGKIILTVDE